MFAAVSKNTLAVDAVVAAMLGNSPDEIPHLKVAGEVFGGWSQKMVQDAIESGMKIF